MLRWEGPAAGGDAPTSPGPAQRRRGGRGRGRGPGRHGGRRDPPRVRGRRGEAAGGVDAGGGGGGGGGWCRAGGGDWVGVPPRVGGEGLEEPEPLEPVQRAVERAGPEVDARELPDVLDQRITVLRP